MQIIIRLYIMIAKILKDKIRNEKQSLKYYQGGNLDAGWGRDKQKGLIAGLEYALSIVENNEPKNYHD